MNHNLDIEVKVGIFVSIGVALIMFTILLLGGGSFFTTSIVYTTRLPQVEGLIEGANVKIMGIRVGKVEKITIQQSPSQVSLKLRVQKSYADSIREDSTVSVQTMGVMGDRYISISPGSPYAQIAKEGFDLSADKPKDFKDYLGSADAVIERLKSSLSHIDNILSNFDRDSRSEVFFRNLASFSTNMNQATSKLPQKSAELYESFAKMNSIMSKIDRGDGTLGALINDPTLYDDLKTLLGGANRNKVLKYFVRKSVEDQRDKIKSEEIKKAELQSPKSQ